MIYEWLLPSPALSQKAVDSAEDSDRLSEHYWGFFIIQNFTSKEIKKKLVKILQSGTLQVRKVILNQVVLKISKILIGD